MPTERTEEPMRRKTIAVEPRGLRIRVSQEVYESLPTLEDLNNLEFIRWSFADAAARQLDALMQEPPEPPPGRAP